MAESRMFVHDAVIARYTLPGGKVFSYTREITREIEREARATAPVRTGRLRDSIGSSLEGTNQYGVNFKVSAGAGHAQYVVRVTAGKGPTGRWGPYGRHGGRLYTLYAEHPGGWLNTRYAPYQYAQVHGFAGYGKNPFMEVALHTVLLAHGLI